MFLDVAFGIWSGLLVPQWFSIEPSYWWVFLGVCFGLLPDIDLVLVRFFPRESVVGRIVDGHHGLTHYPMLWLAVGAFSWVFLGPFFATLFLLPAIFHVVHDTFFLGWGIRWFWPFSMRSYKFFPDKNGRIMGRVFWSWVPEEESVIRKDWGTRDWVRVFYLRSSLISWIEYPIFVYTLWVLLTTR